MMAFSVYDIRPDGSSSPDQLTNVNGEMFFTAIDSAHGRELWKISSAGDRSLTFQPVHTGRSLKLNTGEAFEGIVSGSGDDVLTGNSRPNILNGGPGSDVLTGGTGDDLYRFSNATSAEADQVFELADQGIDTLDFGDVASDVVFRLNLNDLQDAHTNRSVTLSLASAMEGLIGGLGNDKLTGNLRANVLIGNAGNDELIGGGGRDVLIGGVGLDLLSGGVEDDLLVAGTTSHDANYSRLLSILNEWTSVNDYATRIINLRNGVGPNLIALQAGVTALNDNNELDQLSGNADADWFFRDSTDLLIDLALTEIFDEL